MPIWSPDLENIAPDLAPLQIIDNADFDHRNGSVSFTPPSSPGPSVYQLHEGNGQGMQVPSQLYIISIPPSADNQMPDPLSSSSLSHSSPPLPMVVGGIRM